MKKTFLSAAWLLLAASYPFLPRKKLILMTRVPLCCVCTENYKVTIKVNAMALCVNFFHLKNLVGMVFVHGKLLLNGEIFLADVQQQIRLLSATS